MGPSSPSRSSWPWPTSCRAPSLPGVRQGDESELPEHIVLPEDRPGTLLPFSSECGKAMGLNSPADSCDQVPRAHGVHVFPFAVRSGYHPAQFLVVARHAGGLRNLEAANDDQPIPR